jgi:hypothetical protein
MKRLWILIFFLPILMSGCTKEMQKFSDEDAIYMDKNRFQFPLDSLLYMFALLEEDVHVDTLWIPVRVLGRVADKDRPVQFQLSTGSNTAKEGIHFSFQPCSIKAGEITSRCPVVLYRTSDLKTEMKHFSFELVPTSDFPKIVNYDGFYPDYMSSTKKTFENRYRIRINDFLVRPDYWNPGDFLYTQFGSYSEVKFKLIIQVTGMEVWMNNLNMNDIHYYKAQLAYLLEAYEKEHGILYDEYGARVTFP